MILEFNCTGGGVHGNLFLLPNYDVCTEEDVTSAVRKGQGKGWTTEEVTELP